jgi:formamidopyrimidine-DNA glycosylase
MRAVLTVPELPEVETLRRGLAARITGMPITAVSILDRKISGGLGDAIQQDIDGYQVSRMARRGKVLILFLREPGETRQESGSLLIHPKMTGQLVLTVNGATVFADGHPTPGRLRPRDATTRAVFRLGPACCLCYNDARRFGRICPAGPDPCRTDPFLSRLGPGPAGREFHARRAVADARPASPPGQGGPARPDRHRGHRQHLRRRGPAPRPHPPGPPGGRPQPRRGPPPARRHPGHPPRSRR